MPEVAEECPKDRNGATRATAYNSQGCRYCVSAAARALWPLNEGSARLPRRVVSRMMWKLTCTASGLLSISAKASAYLAAASGARSV